MVETAQAVARLTLANHARQLKDARDMSTSIIASLAVGTIWKPKCAAMERVNVELSLWTGMIRVISGRTKHDKIHNRRNHRHWDRIIDGSAAVAADGTDK